MLDKKSTSMLRMIVEASSDGESVVIEKKDFLSEIAKVSEVINEDGLVKIAEDLVLNELINVVYQDDDVICVAPLAKGRIAVNRIVNPKNKELGAIKVDVDYRKIAKYAFLGALAGGILSGVLFTLIGWIIRLWF